MTIVLLDNRAMAFIEREAIKRRLVETGGAIFGWEAEDTIVIACASGPGRKAKHRRHSFEPDRSTTAAAMAAVQVASDGRYGFLGSWHTHPGGAAVPSTTDTGTARDLAGQKPLLLPRPLLLILSTSRKKNVGLIETKVWHWNSDDQQLAAAELQAVELEDRYCPDDMGSH